MDFDKLTYYFKGKTAPESFNEFDGGEDLLNKTKDGMTKSQDAKKYQNRSKSKLGRIKVRKLKH